MKALFGWLAGKALLYIVLAVAIAFFTFAWPSIRSGLSGEALRTDLMSPAQLKTAVVGMRTEAQADLERDAHRIRTLGAAEHATYLARTREELAEAKRQRQADKGIFPAIRPTTILAQKRLELRISALEKRIAALEAAGRANGEHDALQTAQRQLAPFARIPRQEAVQAAERRCRNAQDAEIAFGKRGTVERSLREILRAERTKLAKQRQQLCNQAKAFAARRSAGLAAA